MRSFFRVDRMMGCNFVIFQFQLKTFTCNFQLHVLRSKDTTGTRSLLQLEFNCFDFAKFVTTFDPFRPVLKGKQLKLGQNLRYFEKFPKSFTKLWSHLHETRFLWPKLVEFRFYGLNRQSFFLPIAAKEDGQIENK